jgi:hypothetical protein
MRGMAQLLLDSLSMVLASLVQTCNDAIAASKHMGDTSTFHPLLAMCP